MTKKVKIFSFELTMTSALLLFIFSVFLSIVGFIGLYSVIQTYNRTDNIATAMFFIYSFISVIGLYILIKTIQFRNKS